jgi:hypothetical protein
MKAQEQKKPDLNSNLLLVIIGGHRPPPNQTSERSKLKKL